MSRKIKIAALQLSGPTPVEPDTFAQDKEKIVERLLKLVKEAAAQGVNIACTTELCLTPFFCRQLIRNNDYLFDALPSALIDPLVKEAGKHDMALILAYGERDGIKRYNSALVFDTDGSVLGKYRKVHIPAYFPSNLPGGTGSYERLYFTPGDLGFPTFDIKSLEARVAVQICYDRMFPEGYRILGLKGADIVFNPTNYATYGQKYRIEVWGRLVQSRAYENGMFVCIPNKAGVDGDRENVGRSLVISPRGDILKTGSGDREEVVALEIDLEEAEEGRRRIPYWRDRRPDAYGELVN
ncbi:MAG: carbon-nitrogen hydrolase family protein [Spirochaetales bacterium]|nr:carbon-nitrogen hydrolase family protein [Spirochaetales bacterium]